MRGAYVDITDVPNHRLEFLGYFHVAESDEFQLYGNKGDAHIVHKKGARRFLFVEDLNDARDLGVKFMLSDLR